MKNICRNSKDTKLKCIQIRIHIFEEKYIHIYSWNTLTHTRMFQSEMQMWMLTNLL